VSVCYSPAQIAQLISEFNDPELRETVELSALPDILGEATYFIDVGANVGLYTFHAAKYLRNAKLLAIEANPRLIPVLKGTVDNLRLGEQSSNDYEVKNAAVSDVAGALEFHISSVATLSSIFPCSSTATEKVSVSTVRLDDFYRPQVRTFIKIDIEGAEYRAICSASLFLKSPTARFFVELHGWGDKTIRKYPLHLAWLFLVNGYAVRKVGTHYLFYRGSWPKCVASFLQQLPHLSLKYLVFRYGSGLRRILPGLRRRLEHC
jgi:FkbM family methyltransferase